HTRSYGDWSSDVCSSDLGTGQRSMSVSPGRVRCACARRRQASTRDVSQQVRRKCLRLLSYPCVSQLPHFRLMHVPKMHVPRMHLPGMHLPRMTASILTARSLRWTTYKLSTGILQSTSIG